MIKEFLNRIFKKSKKKDENSITKVSFKQGFKKAGIPIVTLYQGKKKFNFLLDTGSMCNIIDSSILPNIQHKKTEHTCNISGLDGNGSRDDMVEITMNFNGTDYTYFYFAHDLKNAVNIAKEEYGITLHGSLGSEFFNEFKYVLDFDKLIAYSKQ